MNTIAGNIVDIITGKIIKGKLNFANGKIISIESCNVLENQYIIPGFVDAHIHIESSMLVPTEFARMSLSHGTVACVCDPHEIANVCGVEGVNYMIKNGLKSPMKFYFGAPSCVPSTKFETSGAILDASTIAELMSRDDIYFLAEMMNYPGVIQGDSEVISKLKSASKFNKPIDGHAPELRGEDLVAYALQGIGTDHECMSISEAEEKIALGMKIQIREGSAAKNFDDLLELIDQFPDKIMFCSDDKHPDDLLKNGHIDTLVRRALAKGYDIITLLRICTLTPVLHYKLDVGMLQIGDDADFIVVDDLKHLNVLSTYIKGEKVAENGSVTYPHEAVLQYINKFDANKIQLSQVIVPVCGDLIKVIDVEDGQLYTKQSLQKPKVVNQNVVSDVENDVLKLVVYNRYHQSAPAIAFIRNIGLKSGAIASSVSHDSHNIVAVGVDDNEIVNAINQLVEHKGGIIACNGQDVCLLPLPIAGLMSDAPAHEVAKKYEDLDTFAKALGSTLTSPFMTLAFMSLLVLPELKLGDKGLFDGKNFEFTELFA